MGHNKLPIYGLALLLITIGLAGIGLVFIPGVIEGIEAIQSNANITTWNVIHAIGVYIISGFSFLSLSIGLAGFSNTIRN